MGVEKMSVSFDLELGEAIRAAADEESVTVSAWLAEAARVRLRNKALGEALEAWEEKFGHRYTEKEREDARAEARALFDQAKQLARKKQEKARRRGTRP